MRKGMNPCVGINMDSVVEKIKAGSNGGAQYYLDGIPAEKTYGTMVLGGKTYECVRWEEGGDGTWQSPPPDDDSIHRLLSALQQDEPRFF